MTPEDIAEVVSRATGIPVSQLTTEERERLMRLEEELHARIVGQEEAVRPSRRRSGAHAPASATRNRPVGSFLFLGPTGVGKTELARALAEALFGDENLMVRFDMSEFQERHTVSRLVGAPPGYVGYEEAGQLTEQMRRRPYSVLLFDEIEKAHPDVFNILLQILDDGRLTDAQGRTVDFKNAVVIMTSNLGADRIQHYAREGGDFDELKDELMELLRGSFRPEFINRIDEIIVFRALTEEQLPEITKLLLDRLARRLRAQRIEVEFTEEAVRLLAHEGYDPEYGARPLRRTIQRLVENELSRMVLSGDLEPGDKVKVDADGDNLRFDADKGGASELVKEESGRAGGLARVTEPSRLDQPAGAREERPCAVLGVIVAPGLAHEVTARIAAELLEDLRERYGSVDWRTELEVDRLVVPPAHLSEIFAAGRRKLLDSDWDLGVIVTDLPLNVGGRRSRASSARRTGWLCSRCPRSARFTCGHACGERSCS